MAHSSPNVSGDVNGKDGGRDGVKFYPEEEVAALVRALDRPEDKQLFSEDVLRTYPHLATAYTKVCPKRCDLATAARKALEGAYSYAPDLAPLKEDIRLMVSNCVRFNGTDSPLSDMAQAFESFALERIQRYVAGKTGGRRTSSLRFLQSATAAHGPASASAAAAPVAGGKGVVGGPHTVTTATAAASGGPAKKAAAGGQSAEDVFTRRDAVQLVASLVRREDADAFVSDVATVYPELREAYEAVCPHKMNLNMMKQRAQSGVYTHEAASATGRTVADCLPAMREDVELIVHNCIRFNARVEAWVSLARGFQTFAHRRIDDLVLRKLPQLRGTETGAARFADKAPTDAAVPPATPVDGASDTTAAAAKRPREEAGDGTAPKAATTAAAKRRTGQGAASSALSASPSVAVEADVVPSVQPTPLQPALTIPTRLRHRLVTDYLQQESTSLRLVGTTAPLSELLVPSGPVGATTEAARQTAADGGAPAEAVKETQKQKQETGEGVIAANTRVLITEKMSALSLLSAFAASIARFFQHQRRRPDFADPFQFSQQEEESYRRVVHVMTQQFDALLPRALLYEREAAELRRHVARRALGQVLRASATTARDTPDLSAPKPSELVSTVEGNAEAEARAAGRDGAAGPEDGWASQVHYCYLVRFLVQFPQIAALAMATDGADDARASHRQPQHSRRGGALRVTAAAVTMVQHVAKITQELLTFVAEFEDKLAAELCG